MTDTLTITDIGAGGDGVAHDASGRAVFVPLTVSGDVVSAEVDKDGRGRVVEVLEPSPHRVTPPCRHFGICGGCSLQHIDAPFYRGFKKDHVLAAMVREGLAVPDDIGAVFIPDGTRRRANFAAMATKNGTVIGFHERRSANLRDVPDCLLITEEVRGVMERFRPFVADIAGMGKKMDVLIQCADGACEIGLTGKIAPGWEAQQALSDAMRACNLARISLRARDYEAYETLLEARPFYKRFGGLSVTLAPGAFLQPSAEGEAALSRFVVDGAAGATRVADLFCGNGTFTGPLMEGGRDVIAADFAPDAIAGLRRAGANASVRNLFKEPFAGAELAGLDCVVLDPPRAGAAAQVAELAYSSVPRIIYVSCNPQSFARDAAVLVKEGGYALKKLTVVDQFIWSPHTEVAALFTRD